MQVGECSKFKLHPDVAWGSEGLVSKGVPPDAEIDFEITLVSASRHSKDTSSSDVASSGRSNPDLPADYNPCVDAALLKDHGNNRLRANDTMGAYYKYRQALQFLDLPRPTAGPFADGDAYDASVRSLRLALLGNLTEASLRLDRFGEALETADQVLSNDPTNEKALFRRAKALHLLARVPEALSAINQLLQLQPGNRAAQTLRAQIEPHVKDYPGASVDIAPEDARAGDSSVDAATISKGSSSEEHISSSAAANVIPSADAQPVTSSATKLKPKKSVQLQPDGLAAAARRAFGSMYADKPEVRSSFADTTSSSRPIGIVEFLLNACDAVAETSLLSWCGCKRAARGLRTAFGVPRKLGNLNSSSSGKGTPTLGPDNSGALLEDSFARNASGKKME